MATMQREHNQFATSSKESHLKEYHHPKVKDKVKENYEIMNDRSNSKNFDSTTKRRFSVKVDTTSKDLTKYNYYYIYIYSLYCFL